MFTCLHYPVLPRHDPRMGHVSAHVQGEGPGYCVGRVDPAIQVEHIVRNILAIHTYYRVNIDGKTN